MTKKKYRAIVHEFEYQEGEEDKYGFKKMFAEIISEFKEKKG